MGQFQAKNENVDNFLSPYVARTYEGWGKPSL